MEKLELAAVEYRNIELALRSYLAAEKRGEIVEVRSGDYVPAAKPGESCLVMMRARLRLAECS
jgi:hypothetical protein